MCSLGHCRACRLLHSRRSASTFLPPFPRSGFTVRPSRRLRLRYYEGSDPCRPHPGRQVSPLTPPCLPDIPSSTTRSARRSLCQSPQRQRLLPGFATNEQARHGITPKQVRHPTDCQFTSGCSPPRLTATQLPSITGLRPTQARTCTVQTKRPRGRTHPGESRDPPRHQHDAAPWIPAFAGMTVKMGRSAPIHH